MKQLKMISDQVVISGRTIVHNRRIISYDPEANKTPDEKYLEQNINQFYDWINPSIGVEEE